MELGDTVLRFELAQACVLCYRRIIVYAKEAKSHDYLPGGFLTLGTPYNDMKSGFMKKPSAGMHNSPCELKVNDVNK